MRPIFPQLPSQEVGLMTWIPSFLRVLQDEILKLQNNPFVFTRAVTAADVTAGVITVDTTFKSLTWTMYRIQTAANNNAELAWTGAETTNGGLIIFTNAGATPFAAGNILTVVAKGL
jgi:hypothetical protein